LKGVGAVLFLWANTFSPFGMNRQKRRLCEPLLLSPPLVQVNMSEWLYQSKSGVEWRRRIKDIGRVEWKPCLRRILHFPFNLRLSIEIHLKHTLVVVTKDIWSKVYKWAMCAMFQSKFWESRIFSSFLSLLKIFSSNGLVKISTNCSLLLT
jgi:hypothetical protein